MMREQCIYEHVRAALWCQVVRVRERMETLTLSLSLSVCVCVYMCSWTFPSRTHSWSPYWMRENTQARSSL